MITLLGCLLALSTLAWSQQYTLNQYLSFRSARKPTLDPSGNKLAYLTNTSGAYQLWTTELTPSAPAQLTFEPDGVDGAWWSPTDATQLVLAASRGGNERSQLFLLDPAGSPWERLTHDDEAIYAFGGWAQDGSRFAYATNERNKQDFDVYEQPADGSERALLLQAEGYNRAAGYSPDQRYLLVVRWYGSTNSDIFLLDRTTGESRNLTAHEGDVQNHQPGWNGTGAGFYFLSDRGREFVGLAYWDLAGDSMRWVETPDWDVDRLAVAPDGSSMAWTVNHAGYSRFNWHHLTSGERVGPYRLPDGVVRGMTYSRNGRKLAITFGSGTRPFDVWIYETDSGLLQQVTRSSTGGVPRETLRDPMLVEFETFDGRKVPAFWYTPADPGRRMPVIVYIHGGPASQSRPDLSGLFQFFLDRGYAILEPNVRGSSGYGREYLALDNVHKRMDSVKDIEYAAKWLMKQKGIDKNRLIAMGGSYGGFMVLSCLTTYPDLWAAGVSNVGIVNFVSFLENTGAYRRALREAEYGSLEHDREFLGSISPLTHVDRIKAPLFLLQGANDPRVPKSEADQMAAALRERGAVVEYLLFEDEGHGIRKTANKITAYGAVVEFLDKHVMNR